MRKALPCLLIIFIVSVFFVLNTFYVIESNLTDRLITEERAVDQRLKILAIDEESLAQIGKWPWPRQIIAEVAHKLTSQGAKAVWTDVLYTEKSLATGEDEAWEQVIQKHANVYLPVYFEFKPQQKSASELAFAKIKYPVMSIPFAQIGHINVLEDPDRVVRKVMLGVLDEQKRMIPAIGVRLANLLLPEDKQVTWQQDKGWFSGNNPIRTGLRNEVGFSYASNPKFSKFEIIPISYVIQNKIDPAYFAGSIVLIGPYAVGLQDDFQTPMSRTFKMYGVEVHANIIQSLLDQAIYLPVAKTIGIILIIILTALAYFAADRIRARWAIVAALGLIALYTAALVITFKTQHLLLPYFYPLLGILSAYVASVISQYLKERRERNRVTGIFGRYVSKAVVEEILSSAEEIKVGGVRKDVSLMFVDIRGFTPLSEKMEPEDVIKVLNEYLDMGTRAVFTYEGTLDKFIGDAIMAIFGAPIMQEDHAVRAVQAALLMRQEADELSKRLLERYGKTVSFGIGINSGPAVIGNIGSQERLDYTAIGDTVNLAARLESNAKPGQILISRETYERVKHCIKATPLDPIKVKGKEKPVEIYQAEGLID